MLTVVAFSILLFIHGVLCSASLIFLASSYRLFKDIGFTDKTGLIDFAKSSKSLVYIPVFIVIFSICNILLLISFF